MFSMLLALAAIQADDLPPPLQRDFRPSVECAQHLTDDSARRSCLNDLLDTAEDQLDTALEAAREEASAIDMDMPGATAAEAHLEAAHTAWIAYRDAECARRASLLILGQHGEDERLDCLVTETRARTAELTVF